LCPDYFRQHQSIGYAHGHFLSSYCDSRFEFRSVPQYFPISGLKTFHQQ
jgi:hypothetical protein